MREVSVEPLRPEAATREEFGGETMTAVIALDGAPAAAPEPATSPSGSAARPAAAPGAPGQDAPSASLVPAAIGPYRVIRELARGGMAVVYEARHPTLGRTVAIKVLHDHVGAASPASTGFLAEAVAVSRISHPAVVSVFDHGYTDDGVAYLVMELLVGESLAARLARTSVMRIDRAIAIASEIASALMAAHAIGVIHCDLKPDNVHLVPRPDGIGEQVKVLDFGVAKVRDELTAATGIRDVLSGAARAARGRVLGTPAYMAPEQIVDPERVDQRADVYALGCVLYQMVAGQRPWQGSALELATSRARVRPAVELNPAVSPALSKLIERMLARAPSGRPSTMREVAAALAGLVDAPSVPEVAPIRTAITRRTWRRRHPVAVLGIAAGALGLAQVALAWWLGLL